MGSAAALPVTPFTLARGHDKLTQALPAYCSVQEFLDDLETLRASLAEHEGIRIARTLIDPLILQVRTFGLHLHTLDIRQHARVHAAALQEAISDTIAPSLPGGLSARNRQRAGDVPRGGRSQRGLLARGDSPVRDQRRIDGGRCAGRGAPGAAGRRHGGGRGRRARQRSGPDAGAALRVH